MLICQYLGPSDSGIVPTDNRDLTDHQRVWILPQ